MQLILVRSTLLLNLPVSSHILLAAQLCQIDLTELDKPLKEQGRKAEHSF